VNKNGSTSLANCLKSKLLHFNKSFLFKSVISLMPSLSLRYSRLGFCHCILFLDRTVFSIYTKQNLDFPGNRKSLCPPMQNTSPVWARGFGEARNFSTQTRASSEAPSNGGAVTLFREHCKERGLSVEEPSIQGRLEYWYFGFIPLFQFIALE